MDIEDLLLILSISDSSSILGLTHNNRLFINDDLDFRDGQETYDKLMAASNMGYECCIVTANNTYVL